MPPDSLEMVVFYYKIDMYFHPPPQQMVIARVCTHVLLVIVCVNRYICQMEMTKFGHLFTLL